MGAQIRVYRQKIASTSSMRKIFKAMELIAASRIGKARSRVAASTPYANEITRAVSAVASQSEIDHPLTTEPEQIRRGGRAGDDLRPRSGRGLLRERAQAGRQLVELLHEEGKEVQRYLSGRKATGLLRVPHRASTEQVVEGAPTPRVRRRPGNRRRR